MAGSRVWRLLPLILLLLLVVIGLAIEIWGHSSPRFATRLPLAVLLVWIVFRAWRRRRSRRG